VHRKEKGALNQTGRAFSPAPFKPQALFILLASNPGGEYLEIILCWHMMNECAGIVDENGILGLVSAIQEDYWNVRYGGK
jgi:hypothetical protein